MCQKLGHNDERTPSLVREAGTIQTLYDVMYLRGYNITYQLKI